MKKSILLASVSALITSILLAPLAVANQIVVQREDLKSQEEVALYQIKDSCQWPSTTDSSDPSCKVFLGKGTVTQVLGKNMSLVQTPVEISPKVALLVQELK